MQKIQLYDNDDNDSAVAKVALKHQIHDRRLRSVRLVIQLSDR